MSTRILVTGGAGFLGTNLICKLTQDPDNEVIVLDDFSTGFRRRKYWPANQWAVGQFPRPSTFEPTVEWIRHDVMDPFRIECDEIYHLACPASPTDYQEDPIRTILTAVQGTNNALKCAGDVGARIVIASTSEVYGEPLKHPQSEDLWAHINPVGERGCYDTGKAAAESLAHNYSEMGVEVRIARIHNTYGPMMAIEDGRMVSNFIVQALTGEDLTVYGDGMQTRSLCFVDDMVDGLMGLMGNDLGEGQPVNLGNPDEKTVLEVAQTILELCESESEIAFEDLPGDDPTRRCPDIGFAKRMFNFNPKVELIDGLTATVEYFRLCLGDESTDA